MAYPDQHAPRGMLEAFLRVHWAEVKGYGAPEARELMKHLDFPTTESSVLQCISRLRKAADANRGVLPPPGPVVAELLATLESPKGRTSKKKSVATKSVTNPPARSDPPVPASASSGPDLASVLRAIMALSEQVAALGRRSPGSVVATTASLDLVDLSRKLGEIFEQQGKLREDVGKLKMRQPPSGDRKVPPAGEASTFEAQPAAVIAAELLMKVRSLSDAVLRPQIMGTVRRLLERTQASSQDFVEVVEAVVEGLLDTIHQLKTENADLQTRRERLKAPPATALAGTRP